MFSAGLYECTCTVRVAHPTSTSRVMPHPFLESLPALGILHFCLLVLYPVAQKTHCGNTALHQPSQEAATVSGYIFAGWYI